MSEELKAWPFFGYAPGHYTSLCQLGCGKQFEGDKRAMRCLECAVIASRTPTEAEPGDLTRDERLDYERRILAAEIEWNRLARKALPFLALIERNTPEIDDAFIVANAVHERRGLDRLTAEPWMPTLLDLRATILGHDLLSQQLADEYGDCDEADPGEAKVERVGSKVHGAMVYAVNHFKGEPQPWQNGNSHAEHHARTVAEDILALRSTTPASDDQRRLDKYGDPHAGIIAEALAPAVAVDDDALVGRLRAHSAAWGDDGEGRDFAIAADRLQSLQASVREARLLIGESEQKDDLPKARREANRNRAWHILTAALSDQQGGE